MRVVFTPSGEIKYKRLCSWSQLEDLLGSQSPCHVTTRAWRRLAKLHREIKDTRTHSRDELYGDCVFSWLISISQCSADAPPLQIGSEPGLLTTTAGVAQCCTIPESGLGLGRWGESWFLSSASPVRSDGGSSNGD